MAIDKVNPSAAAGIYANTQKGVQGIGVSGNDGRVSFGDFVMNAARDSADTMHQGEKMQAEAVIGKADLTDVVEAVTNAELTLQTVVALRDKMLAAYQEIMRMPI
jgi:flagellar hook-basal body complex protein FliE